MRKNFLPLAKPFITNAEIRAVSEVLRSGNLTTGLKVTEFEQAISKYIGEGIHAVGLNSCTAGLHLALLAYGIGKGDEAIILGSSAHCRVMADDWADILETVPYEVLCAIATRVPRIYV